MSGIDELAKHILELVKLDLTTNERRKAIEIFIRTFGTDKQKKLWLSEK